MWPLIRIRGGQDDKFMRNHLKTRDREKVSEKHTKSERRTEREREWERETVWERERDRQTLIMRYSDRKKKERETLRMRERGTAGERETKSLSTC